MHSDSRFSASYQQMLFSIFLMTVILTGTGCYLFIILLCISQMNSDIEHLFCVFISHLDIFLGEMFKSFPNFWMVFNFCFSFLLWNSLELLSEDNRTLEIVKGPATPTYSHSSWFYIQGGRTHRLPPAAAYVWLSDLYFATKFLVLSEIVCTQVRKEIGFKSTTLIPDWWGGGRLSVVQVTAQTGVGSGRRHWFLAQAEQLMGKGHTAEALPHLCALGYWFRVGIWISMAVITVQFWKLREANLSPAVLHLPSSLLLLTTDH